MYGSKNMKRIGRKTTMRFAIVNEATVYMFFLPYITLPFDLWKPNFFDEFLSKLISPFENCVRLPKYIVYSVFGDVFRLVFLTESA